MRTQNPRPAAAAGKPLVITRVFNAPRSLVFKAWTQAEHLTQWWGQPKGATMPYCKVDLRVGGTIHFCVNLPDGMKIWGKGVYREVVTPERLVFFDYFSDEHGNIAEPPPGLPKETVITATFVERNGKTTVTVEHAGVEQAPPEMQQAYRQGWGESLDRLAEDLAKAPTREVAITRVFDAPRELVFKAWTDAAHMAQWWGPKMFTNPVCEVDARPGGAIYIVMRAPDGVEYPMRGVFLEVAEPERIVFTAVAQDKDGNALLEAHTVVSFAQQGGKTRLTVQQRAVGLAPVAPQMLAGMEAGWTQSLERLADLVPTNGTTKEATLVGDREIAARRTFNAPRELVWKVWTEPEHIGQWWGPKGFTTTTYAMELKPGGVWRFVMHGPDRDYQNKITYLEVLKPERLVYRHGGDKEVEPVNFHVTVIFTEQGGKTRIDMRMVFPSANARDYVVKTYGAVEGLNQTLGRLEEYLGARALSWKAIED